MLASALLASRLRRRRPLLTAARRFIKVNWCGFRRSNQPV